jgi:dolichol-phosphate mannosyltransferase
MTDATGQPCSLDLTVMLPAYKEADTLRDLLPTIKAAAAALTPDFEILILDTQTAMDDTGEVCALNGVTHIQRSGGNQYGDAIRTGIAQARGKFLLCMDADGSHSASYFPAMWARRVDHDIVIGSRYVAGGHTENPAILIWMSYAVNFTFRVVFNIHARDVTNSLRLYRTAILKPMRLESNAFDVLEEILIKAVTHRPPARVCEVPVTFGRRKAGESKRKLLQFALGYLTTLRKLRKFQRAARREMESQ